jgi:hypothetical protein
MTAAVPDQSRPVGRLRRFLTAPLRVLWGDPWLDLPDLSVDPQQPLLVTRMPQLDDYADRVAAVRARMDELWSEKAVDEGADQVLDGEILAAATLRDRIAGLEHQQRRLLVRERDAMLAAAHAHATAEADAEDKRVKDLRGQLDALAVRKPRAQP